MNDLTDVQVIQEQPDVKIWGADFSKLYETKVYKGKFVLTRGGKFIAKVLPVPEYDKTDLFHNMLLEELGVKNAESTHVKHEITGGGKIDIELVDDYLEVRLRGKSTVYGPYDPKSIDLARLETAFDALFHLGMMPVLIIPKVEA